MDHKVKVSVILPVFNGKKFIDRAIQSVLDQTFEDFELIIVDDTSTDNTIEVIHQFKDSRIHLIKHKNNKGVCVARNTGLQAARGGWVAPIDADDAWHRDRLKTLLGIAEQDPGTFVGSNLLLCFSGRNKELIPWKTLYEYRCLNFEHLFYPTTVDVVKYGLSTTWPIFPSEIVKKFSIKFQQRFKGHDWTVFLLNLFRFGLKYIIIKEPLYYYRITPNSSSNSWLDMATQIKACEYLQTVDWVDKETRLLIKESVKISKYRLLTAALRERRWGKVLQHLIQSPMSICYLLRRLPAWISRQREFQKLSKNNSIYPISFRREMPGFRDKIAFVAPFFNSKRNEILPKNMDIEDYSRHIQFYIKDIPKLLLKFLNKVNWKSYLDLGCGDGSLLYTLNKKGYFKNKLVYAIDLSKNRINLVKKINKDFRCFVDDACNIQNIKDNSINFLVSTQLIEHVANDEDLVKEISRVLDKNCIVYLSTIFKKWYAWYFYRCNGKWTLDPTHLREYTRDNQLLDIFRKYGFEITENKKSLTWRPVIDFVFRRIVFRIIGVRRNMFNNRFLKLLRNLKVPIPGYYYWEIVCEKK